MSRRAAVIIAGAWLLAGSGVVRAQIPGLPGGAGGASALSGAASALGGGSPLGGASGATGAAGLGAAAPGGFCSGLKTCLAGCKQKICASPLGSLINNGIGPYSTLSGGLIPQFCPTVPTDATIAALAAQGGPNGAGAVAAKVQQDEAEAKARRAAVKYLGTVDCHYWPDAEVAILSALRDDRNECVRYEAALALLNGCCCNARTIEALNIVVSGSEKDGKPSETSGRVQMTALAALQGCLLRYTPPPVAPPEAPDPVETSRAPGPLDPAFRRVSYYYATLASKPPERVVAEARRTIAQLTARPSSAATAPVVPGQRSVYHALARATAAPPKPARAADRPEAPTGPGSDPGVSTASAPILTLSEAAAEPTAAPDLPALPAPMPAPGARDAAARPIARPAPGATRSHRGLFGILRDSVDPRPGS